MDAHHPRIHHNTSKKAKKTSKKKSRVAKAATIAALALFATGLALSKRQNRNTVPQRMASSSAGYAAASSSRKRTVVEVGTNRAGNFHKGQYVSDHGIERVSGKIIDIQTDATLDSPNRGILFIDTSHALHRMTIEDKRQLGESVDDYLERIAAT